jgi:signal peptidase I
MTLLDELYAIALYAYPAEFRSRFGREMQQVFRTRRASAPSPLNFLLATARDLIVTAVQERFAIMNVSQFAIRAALGIALFLGISATMVQAFYIPAGSMEPSLRIGDHVLVNKLAHDPQRGEMVVFRFPDDPSQTFIKRVIGLPGDRIRLENKQVVRNGEPLMEAYVEHRDDHLDTFRDNFPGPLNVHLEPRGQDMLAKHVDGGEVVVPKGSLFVLGDNRDRSLDSRFFGFVPQENVIGRPWMVYWSYDEETRKTRWERTLLRP